MAQLLKCEETFRCEKKSLFLVVWIPEGGKKVTAMLLFCIGKSFMAA